MTKKLLSLFMLLIASSSQAWVYNGIELQMCSEQTTVSVDEHLVKIVTPYQLTYSSFNYIDCLFDDGQNLKIKAPTINNTILINGNNAIQLIEKMKKNQSMTIKTTDYQHNEVDIIIDLTDFNTSYCNHLI